MRFLALALALLALAAPALAAPGQAVVTAVQGRAQVKGADGVWRDLRVLDKVGEQDTVRTGSEAGLELTAPDGSVVQLGERRQYSFAGGSVQLPEAAGFIQPAAPLPALPAFEPPPPAPLRVVDPAVPPQDVVAPPGALPGDTGGARVEIQ